MTDDREKIVRIESAQHFTAAIDELKLAMKRSRQVAYLAASLGMVGLIVGATLGIRATADGAEKLQNAEDAVPMLIFELVRTAATAALIGAFIWGMLNLARAALDQSTRYEKRYVAGHFLVHILDKFDPEIRSGAMNIADAMSVFNRGTTPSTPPTRM